MMTSKIIAILSRGLLGCNIMVMTAKQKVLDAVQKLPDDASFEDAIERIVFLSKIEKGIEEADSGRTLDHEEVKKRFLG